MYITRNLESTILDNLPKKEILAILGPRQSGKTTLLKHIAADLRAQNKEQGKEVHFISFEDQKTLDLYEEDIDAFVALHVAPFDYVFIDEFQYAGEGGKKLKYIYDHFDTKIVVSGSSAPDLTIEALRYLVGRVFVFSLMPLSFEEFLSYKDSELYGFYMKNHYDLHAEPFDFHPLQVPRAILASLRDLYNEYAVFGGYPRVVTAETPDEKKLVLQNIYNTLFLREVRDNLGLIEDHKLSSLLKKLAIDVTGLIDYSDLTDASGLAYATVKNYLNFLEKVYICKQIRPFFKNKSVELVKNPRVYFYDSGLRNYVAEDFRDLGARPDTGALLEEVFAMELFKHEIAFNYWRTKKGEELDFVLKFGVAAGAVGKMVAVECKSKLKSTHLTSASVNAFKKSYPEIPLFFGFYALSDGLFKRPEDTTFPAFPLALF